MNESEYLRKLSASFDDPVDAGALLACANTMDLLRRDLDARGKYARTLRATLESLEQAYTNPHSPVHRAACLSEARAVLATNSVHGGEPERARDSANDTESSTYTPCTVATATDRVNAVNTALDVARCPKCGARVESIGNPCPERCGTKGRE